MDFSIITLDNFLFMLRSAGLSVLIAVFALIGGVILIWKLAVAVWYLPLTVYRLFA